MVNFLKGDLPQDIRDKVHIDKEKRISLSNRKDVDEE